jgi:hypothetical protein
VYEPWAGHEHPVKGSMQSSPSSLSKAREKERQYSVHAWIRIEGSWFRVQGSRFHVSVDSALSSTWRKKIGGADSGGSKPMFHEAAFGGLWIVRSRHYLDGVLGVDLENLPDLSVDRLEDD